ncbi:MAG: rod shape-determining protein MreD [Rhodobacteraceae bacterium PARR1]|nr:MAG: rod shape-determining protein MreD [Rhodobacteraceae bacterium PARR1]
MIDPARASLWVHRGGIVLIAFALIFFKLLPIGSNAGDWPGPDLMLCLILAMVLRRPDYLPIGLVLGVVLLEDLLLLRPPGLWAALVVLASEFVRSRAALTRELSFWVEWMLIAGVMVGLLVAYRVAFAITFLPQAGFGFAMMQVLWSILCYPLVVGVLRLSLDLRKPATGEVDSYGRRL